MPKSPTVNAREQAAKINPIISCSGKADTLSQCAQLIDQLGRFVSEAPSADGVPLMYLLTGAISSAINFELEAENA